MGFGKSFRFSCKFRQVFKMSNKKIYWKYFGLRTGWFGYEVFIVLCEQHYHYIIQKEVSH